MEGGGKLRFESVIFENDFGFVLLACRSTTNEESKKKKKGKEEGENDVWMTHVLESLVLLFEFGIGGQQLLLGLIQVVFELLHLFLQSAHLFLRLYRNSFIKSMH